MTLLSQEQRSPVIRDAAARPPEKPRLPLREAVTGLARCAARTAVLIVRGRIHQPHVHLGRRLRFADGTAATVYRETVVDRGPTGDPVVLIVGFRLRRVRRGWGHALFRWESLLNTVLFVGFPGFVSKLWLAHDANHLYRGVYEWDGAGRAERYVGALRWVLALVSERGSIHYAILPGLRRDDVLARPEVVPIDDDGDARAWWRLRGAGAAAP